MHFQMRIMFEVYDIDMDDIDDLDSSHILIEKMFKIANNALNMTPEQDHDLYCKRLVMAMMNDPLLKKGIVQESKNRLSYDIINFNV